MALLDLMFSRLSALLRMTELCRKGVQLIQGLLQILLCMSLFSKVSFRGN